MRNRRNGEAYRETHERGENNDLSAVVIPLVPIVTVAVVVVVCGVERLERGGGGEFPRKDGRESKDGVPSWSSCLSFLSSSRR
jgi:hypothetical protein